jgi:hypothetical protein
VDARNIYTLADPLPAVDRLLLGRPGSVVELGLQRPGAGAVRHIRIRRNAGYFTVDHAPDRSDGTANYGSAMGGASLAPRVRVRRAAQAPGASRRVPDGGSGGGTDSHTVSTGSVGEDRVELAGTGVVWCFDADSAAGAGAGDGGGLPIAVSVTEGSPAARNGCIAIGDRLRAVDGVQPAGVGSLKAMARCRAWAELVNGAMGSWTSLSLIAAEGAAGGGDDEEDGKLVRLRRVWLPDTVSDGPWFVGPATADGTRAHARRCGTRVGCRGLLAATRRRGRRRRQVAAGWASRSRRTRRADSP